MERIKRALERAKVERQARQESRERSSKHQSGGQYQPPSSENRQTQVIDVSPDTLNANRIVTLQNDQPISGAYNVLRTQVLQRMQKNGWQTLGVTSANENEGKTLTAVNLAVSLAREIAKTVLLVEADLRRPSVHKYFGYKPVGGLTDHIVNGLPLSDVLFSPQIDRLVVLPAGTKYPNTAELLRSPEMVELVTELKCRYDNRLILFDLPPLLAGDDALAFTPYIDCVLLVIEEGKTPPKDVTRSVELLKQTNFLGSVLNKSKIPQANYY